MRTLVLALVGLFLSGAANADEIFRWVDAGGVVNYGSHAPDATVKGVSKAHLIDTSSPVVSRDAAGAQVQRRAALLPVDATDALKRKLLQEQIETEQARQKAMNEQAAKDAATRALALARAQCDASRVVNCDIDPDDGWGNPVYYRGLRPAVRRWLRARAPSQPTQTVQAPGHFSLAAGTGMRN